MSQNTKVCVYVCGVCVCGRVPSRGSIPRRGNGTPGRCRGSRVQQGRLLVLRAHDRGRDLPKDVDRWSIIRRHPGVSGRRSDFRFSAALLECELEHQSKIVK